MPDWNNIKSRFEDDNFKVNPWLNPSKDLLDGLGILEEEKKEQKESKPYWLWFYVSLGFLFVAVFIFFLFKPSSSNPKVYVKGQQKSSEISKVRVKAEEVKSNALDSNDERPQKRSETAKSLVALNQTNEALKESTAQFSLNNRAIHTNDVEFIERVDLLEGKSSSQIADSKFTFDQNSTQGGFSKKITTEKNRRSTILMPLAQKEISPMDFEQKVIISDKRFIPIELKSIERPFTQQLAFGVGVSQGTFRLNQLYSDFLDPADFSHGQTKGMYGFVEYAKNLGKNWLIKTSVSYERSSFDSGHNSEISYCKNCEDENVSSNSIDLVMASPVGLLSSNLVVNRMESFAGDNIDLTVNLNNRHTISFVNLDLAVGRDIIANPRQRLQLFSGIGVNYFSKIENELHSFFVDHDDFSSGNAGISSDQMSINEFLYTLNFGLNYSRTLKENTSLSISGEYRSALNPIFNELDFSSDYNRLRLSLGIVRHF